MFKISYELTRDFLKSMYPSMRIYGEVIPGRSRNYEVFLVKGNKERNIWVKRISKKTLEAF